MDKAGAHQVDVIGDVKMQTRDGVTLVADIYRPQGEGPFPVLLHRTPYGKRGGRPYPNMDRAFNEGHLFASHGYITVVQDVRGRGVSEGEDVPFFHEAEDGYDTIEWAAALDGSSGDVGMFGQSYDAMCQYLVLPLQPPSLRAAVPISAPISYFDHCVYTSGAFNLGWMLHWVVINLVLRGPDKDAALEVLRDFVLDADEPTTRRIDPVQFKHRPIKDWADRVARFAPYLADHIAHSTNDDYWKPLNLSTAFGDITVPMLHVSSWYDGFQKGSLGAFTGLTAAGAGQAAQHALIVGPWTHTIYTDVSSGKAGELDFGPDAALDVHEIELAWFARHLKGEKDAPVGPPVRLFVMGPNAWRDEQEWPLSRARQRPLYLRSGTEGGGALSWEPPADEEPDHYRYDPDEPVPTIGGHHLGVYGMPNGPFDQSPTVGRPDVLVYTSEPVDSDLEITGPVSMSLHAASSAPDTDFVAKLIDVHPNGYAQMISEGIVRARLRDSQSEPSLLTPGEPTVLTIDMYAVSHVVAPGHRLRVHVTSSDFPQWDANPNTGAPFGQGAEVTVADQTVFHDAVRASHVLVPVIDDNRSEERR